MRDNEFEKGVQEKMGEFRLPPSAPVWVEVERSIRERKRRRILIFWFCLAGLLMAGLGGWWFWESNERPALSLTKEGNNSSVNSSTENNTKGTREEIALPAKGDKEQKINAADPTSSPSVGKDLSKNNRGETTTGRNAPLPVKISSLKQADKKTVDRDRTSKEQITAGSGKKTRKQTLPKNKVTTLLPDNDSQVATQKSTTEFPVASTSETLNNTEPPVPVTAKLDVALPAAINTAKHADTVQAVGNEKQQTKPSLRKSRKSKWQTGIVFAFGESRLTQGGLTLFSEKSFDALQSGVSNGSGNFYNQSFADSVPLRGPGIHAGLFVKRKVGKKTSFSTGINLAFYSGKQRVGEKVDSVRRISTPFNNDTREGFYRSGSSANYVNRYYYLQVPLLLHWQLNKGSKWPAIEWENGFVPSFLFGSRALVYDPAGRIFFRDNKVYNSFSLVYQTGFTATLASRTKHPLTAGVYYNYHLSRLQKVNPPDFNHQSSYGIQFRWLLKK